MSLFKREHQFYADTGQVFVKYLRNALNSPAMNVNGSVTPVEFYFEVPANYYLLLKVVTLYLYDNANFNADNFGGTANPLINGVLIGIKDATGTMVTDLLDGTPIKANGDICAFADQGIIESASRRGLSATFNFAYLTSGDPVRVKPGHRFVAIVRDNLTPLVQMRIVLKGMLIRKDEKQ